MYFFQEPLVEYALGLFAATDFKEPAQGNWFFGLFAPGNALFFAERPFERFSDYEELLRRLRKADPQKYQQLHKGTPFYFMSWLAFDLRNRAPAGWKGDQARETQVLNALFPLLSRNRDATLALFELIKNQPGY